MIVDKKALNTIFSVLRALKNLKKNSYIYLVLSESSVELTC